MVVENPQPTITFNLGTEHQQAKIYWEYTIHDKPAFTISFNAIETKSNSKCSGPRHYFYPDHESLEIKDTKGVIIKEGESKFVIKIWFRMNSFLMIFQSIKKVVFLAF